MNRRVDFVKGHGTENDFVLLPDPDGALAAVLEPRAVRTLSDRHAGLGADGVIRVVRTAKVPEVADQADLAEWFMDYRNADGSLAQMCGNGVRVMATYLLDAGLVEPQPALKIATRGGVRTVHVGPDGQVTVEMGRAAPMAPGSEVTVRMGKDSWPAVAVAAPNPHAVVFLDEDSGQVGPDALEPLNRLGLLTRPPVLSPSSAFPEGANVEFVVAVGDRHIALRVWERGVGETRSCGTGVCAAAWAAMRRDDAAHAEYVVDVPGGRLTVTERLDDELVLTGPARLGVRGVVAL